MTKKITFLIAFALVAQLSWAQSNISILNTSLKRYALPSSKNYISLEVKNNGDSPISSLKINWTDGIVNNEQIIRTHIPKGETKVVKHPVAVNYNGIVNKDITVSVTEINNNSNFIAADNNASLGFNTVTKSGKRAVIFEKVTGTWCMYCPRGYVSVEHMEKLYPDGSFIGIAVHKQDGNDPMAVDKEYAKFLKIKGAPGCEVDRKLKKQDVARKEWEDYYKSRIDLETPVDIYAKGTKSGRDISITASAKFYSDFPSADFRFAVIVMEDGVTGTTEDYDQANYFGVTKDEMAGWENKPNPVPAKDMVYNHTARTILGGFKGQENSVPTNIKAGQTVDYTFKYKVPREFNVDELKFVVVLMDNADMYKDDRGNEYSGSFVNGKKFDWKKLLSVNKVSATMANVSMFPNPVNDKLTISLTDAELDNYTIRINDMLGRTVSQSVHHSISGAQNISLPMSGLSKGNYIVSISNNSSFYSKMILVK